MVTAVITIFLKIPKLENVAINNQSNDMLSGGWGPNQVSAALGYGFALVGMAMVINIRLTRIYLVDIAIGLACLGFGILTFSRGGVITAIITVLACVYISIRNKASTTNIIRVFRTVIIIAIAGVFIWQLVDGITGGKLSHRYLETINEPSAGTTAGSGSSETLNLAGRGEIAEGELSLFYSHPLIGVGAGMAPIYRTGDPESKTTDVTASHTEFSRLLSEHGLFGLIIIVMIIYNPIVRYGKVGAENKIILTAFVLIALLTQLHAATRLAFSCFTYGLAFINYEDFKHPLQKPEKL
jgi:O-antigen ligase